MSWHPLGPAEEFPPGSVRRVQVADRWLAVGQGSEGYFAVDDTCPHAGASLGEGMVDGAFVICPLHAYAYHSKTGACEDEDDPVRTFPVRRSGDELEVELPA